MYDSSLVDVLTKSISFLDQRYGNLNDAICFARDEPYTYDCQQMGFEDELREEWINQSGSNGFPSSCSFCADDTFDPTTGCNPDTSAGEIDPGGIGCSLTGLLNSGVPNLVALFEQYVSPFNQVPNASAAPVCAGCRDHGQMIPPDQTKCDFVDIVEEIYADAGGTPNVYTPGGSDLQVFSTGSNATFGADRPGVFVGTMYQSNWNSNLIINGQAPFGGGGLNLPGGSLEGFGSPAVRVYGKTELRDGADFSDGSVTCGPECIEGIMAGAGRLPHDRYDIIHVANPVRVGVVVKDVGLCNCLQQELNDVEMEWNQTGDWMDYDGGRIGTVVNGYRYNYDGDTGNRRRQFSKDDQISTISESESEKWTPSTKWKIRVRDLGQKSGDVIGNLLPQQTSVLTPDLGLNAGPSDVYPAGQFELNDSSVPDTIAAKWYHNPLATPDLGGGTDIGICSATSVFVFGNDQFGRVFVDGGNNGIQVPNIPQTSGVHQTYLLCNGNAGSVISALPGSPGQVPNFDGLLNDGRCDVNGNCIKDATSGAGACSYTGNSFAPFYLPPSPCKDCTSPFTRTLPVGYGSAVDGFVGVSPRSSAFSDYVSNSFFRDNYANESQTDFGQLFMGYYLARKIVDGECVTMLCPEDSNSDNYCKALRDCK